jgi:hypothetical protein
LFNDKSEKENLTSCIYKEATHNFHKTVDEHFLFVVWIEGKWDKISLKGYMNLVNVQGPPKKCIHNLTKGNSTLYNRLL